MSLSDVGVEEERRAFRQELIDAGHLIPSGVRGVYGRSGEFERVIGGFSDFVTRSGSDMNAEVMRFPPVLGRQAYEASAHLETMPDLVGSVHSFEGDGAAQREMVERANGGGDWTEWLTPTEVVMVPAACYPLYPTATGTLPEGGRVVDLEAYVFRNEPSDDPARMQVFRQREYVYLGTAEGAVRHRDEWLRRGQQMLEQLGLAPSRELANDPFFGRGGALMKATQREQDLKYEIVVPIASEDAPTAVVSCNCHLDHFGLAYDIRSSDGAVAHSACVGFGLERIALALFRAFGMDTTEWPDSVRDVLGLR